VEARIAVRGHRSRRRRAPSALGNSPRLLAMLESAPPRWQPLAELARAVAVAPVRAAAVSGKLGIKMDDGTELIAGPGDVTALPSGHDAWVIGNEPVVVIDWFGASNYGKSRG
jgi:hypothetical protein